jgi:uncharacterized Zn finger protein
MGWYREWRPYVPVAKRRAKAASFATKLAKKERRELLPVQITGRLIARSFWGQAWCQNLEQYSDFANRLPRGRSYARNGSVLDLQIKRGAVHAIVSGSEIYNVTVKIKTLPKAAWSRVKQGCSQSIASLIDLLQGRFDDGVMQRLTHPEQGLFPRPVEIEMKCTCPDWAVLCKHVAAVLYGVGARLDTAPELLFTLRDVDHLELVSAAVSAENLDRTLTGEQAGALSGDDLGAMFGIDLESADAVETEPAPTRKRSAGRATAKKSKSSKKPGATRRGKAAAAPAESEPAAATAPAADNSPVKTRPAKKKAPARQAAAKSKSGGTPAHERKIAKKSTRADGAEDVIAPTPVARRQATAAAIKRKLRLLAQ